jgi:4-hydroxy-L-threonine phosphate dehydrogenase PdxA
MKNNFIIVVAGEPKSIFLEVFFKALKNKYNRPIILICNKKILIQQMRISKFKKKIKILEIKNLNHEIIDNSKINLINVDFYNNEVSKYLKNSFDLAFKLIKNKFSDKFINGPINKINFLNKKFLGLTEYISQKFKINKTGMLIYNKNLSVSPLTTHLPLKLVAKKITKKKLKENIEIIDKFYQRIFKLLQKLE